jgi:uncharacterized protein
MILVADCSALVALACCDGLLFLESLYGQVFVSEEVYSECTIAGKPYADILSEYLHGKVRCINPNNQKTIIGIADKGETQAMQLYLQLEADNLLIDNKHGKKIAMQNKINTIGSLTVLIIAKQQNLIPAIKPHIEMIRNSNVFIADVVLDTALRIVKEL